jgi:type VI secretion system protein ImpL
LVVNLLIVVLLLIIGGLIYIAGPVLHIQGNTLLLFRALLAAIGIAAISALLFLRRRNESRENASESSDSAASTSDLNVLLEDAERKLRAGQQAGPRSLTRMPLLYLLGDANAAKTTTILHSSLDAELLAGHVYSGNDVVPTPLVNVWYAAGFAIVETGQAIRSSNPLLARLLNRTRPVAYRSAFGKGAPPRAAVVCISLERFLSPDAAASSTAAARAAGAQLREISRSMGTAIPVYVLFTKLDRVPHFAEFARNLSTEEGAGVLGSTVSAIRATAGIYTEQATAVIGNALDSLFFSLAGFRVELLDRENDAQDAGLAYEFPRELRKLRNPLTQFLVELSKPSQLSSNPYLRGFYFTGVRAQVVEQVVAAPASASASAPEAGATRMFTLSDMKTQAPRPPQVVSRRVPQWTFLPRLFPQAILNDRPALTASKESTPARLFRRLLFGTIATAAVAYLALLLISYTRNAALERRITDAADMAAAGAAPSGVLTMQQLQGLDELRSTILQLENWQQNGAPWTYRAGLYQGGRLVSGARQLYFDRFRPLILESTQRNLVSTLNALPAAPAAGADYTAAYNPLKAYLITTTNPEKSTAEFLSPVLLEHWPATPVLGADEQQLARAQMDFYAAELRRANPYSIAADTVAVSHARTYLSKFGGPDRVYQGMLAAAGKANPPIEFNKLFPGSSEAVVDNHAVPGAFTRSGFSFMQDAIAHPDRYFSGETWVLGNAAAPSLDRAAITQQLTTLYTADYVKEWRAFLGAARVNGYRNLPDASAKLNLLAGPTSPLLALFFTISHNTAVTNPDIAHVFQPAQVLVPPDSQARFIGPGNKPYIDSLLALQGTIAQASAQNPAAPPDPAAATPILTTATAAHTAARQAAQAFTIDQQTHTETTSLALLEAPIKSVEALVRGIAPAAANSGGRTFCGSFDALMTKFPFAAASSTPASVAEVNAVLAPETGALWQFYNASLKTLLIQQGTQFMLAPGAAAQVSTSFLRFFNRATALSSALYPAGAKNPSLTFSLRELPSKGVQNATLSVDGQRVSSANVVQQFTWNAQTAASAELTASYLDAKDLPLLHFPGTWSLFSLLDKAHAQRTSTGAELEFPLEISGTPIKLPDGTPLVVRFDLSGSGAELLTPGAFNGLRCVSHVAN